MVPLVCYKVYPIERIRTMLETNKFVFNLRDLLSKALAGLQKSGRWRRPSDFGGLLMKRAMLFLTLAVFSSAPILRAQEKTAEPEELGKVHFPVSCTSAAQQQFDRAVAMQHSFWVLPAANAFAEVAKSDPDCALADWGIAINLRANPPSAPPTPAAPQERAAA